MPAAKKLIVCDLDNTLYDWVHYFVSSFYSMVDEVVRLTGCDRERLLDDFRRVHQQHHDSEHPFALLETMTIKELFDGWNSRDITQKLNPAFYAFNSTRKKTLRLHSGVREGLEALKKHNITIVAHTESKLYAAVDRLARLDLEKYFGRIYCRERSQSEHPEPERGRRWLDEFPMHKITELASHQMKPNPEVLHEICRVEGYPRTDVAYVGDSMARDILMAKSAGVFAIWAKYGASHSKDEYDRLVRISHWTPEDVERESRLREKVAGVRPDHVAERSFCECLDAIGVQETLHKGSW